MKNQLKYTVLTFLGLAISQITLAQGKATAVSPVVDKAQEFNHIMQWVLLITIGVLVLATASTSIKVMRIYQGFINPIQSK